MYYILMRMTPLFTRGVAWSKKITCILNFVIVFTISFLKMDGLVQLEPTDLYNMLQQATNFSNLSDQNYLLLIGKRLLNVIAVFILDKGCCCVIQSQGSKLQH